MVFFTIEYGRSPLKTTTLVLAPLLLLISLTGCTARHVPYWSEVQSVVPETETEVQLYEDKVSPGGLAKIKGRFHSSTENSVKLTVRTGQAETFQRPDVRKVLTHRPFWKRKSAWIALGITAAVAQYFIHIDPPTTASEIFAGHAIATLPIAAAVFYGSRMEGIYEVPPKHRDSP